MVKDLWVGKRVGSKYTQHFNVGSGYGVGGVWGCVENRSPDGTLQESN